ncbi:MAG: tRNA pseudouridine32 synthase / rRNA pseudouridine746 synthase [Chloroflexota bacterium]|nr:tRNA pseudouridine32 synthase / rRNA pseudouridine746 synthase [Chloroflexota bacterium]
MDCKDFVLFEDESLVVLNKPAGWLSIPGGYAATLPSLKEMLALEYGQIWAVHRLDKMTSGVLLFARTEAAHRELNRQFSQRIPTKNYRAVCHGFPIWQERIIDVPLRVNGDRRHRTVVDLSAGKNAQTRVQVSQRNERFCAVDVYPKTGLTHQIRAHLAACGLPIVGDRLYWHLGAFPGKNQYTYPFEFENMYLHAYSISLQHPLTQDPVQFIAPEPVYFSHDLPY